MIILKLSLTIGTHGTVTENISKRNFMWTIVVSLCDAYFDLFATVNCREYNIRASLIPLSGFNYQPVFLEPEEAKCLHNPLSSKPGVVKPALTSKTSLSLKKKNKTIKSDGFNNDFLKTSVLFQSTSI